MPDYRLYLLDLRADHITGVEQFHAADDAEAIGLATQRQEQVPTELWCGGRKVSRFDASPAMAPQIDVVPHEP